MATTQSRFKFTPLYKPRQLVCGSGQVALVTGWTMKQVVVKQLSPSQFAVVGQLYSPTRGINILIRNLLWNPHVRFLVAINATKEDKNSGAVKCLIDFFRNGFDEGTSDIGKACWVIRSEVFGCIDIEIERKSLDQLRGSISFCESPSAEDAIQRANEFNDAPPMEAWGEPKAFLMEEITPNVLPGPRYGHRVEGATIAETWVKIIHRIKTTGTIRPTGYDGQWQELIDLMAVVNNEPRGFYFPHPNYLPCDQDYIQEYIPQILEDPTYSNLAGVKYPYGQRLRSWFGKDQVEQVIQKLIHEIDAASAVMSLWDVKDHDSGGSPCLNHIWLRVVDNEISLTALFRSNDMFSAWPANAMGLRALQEHIRDAIALRSKYDLAMGPLITISQSAHIYDDCWENADNLIKKQYNKLYRKNNYDDPSGNFIIEIHDKEIMVTQTTPGNGEEVNKYRGKSPLNLVREICKNSPCIHPDHIGYLGTELQKAKYCIKHGKSYSQDSES